MTWPTGAFISCVSFFFKNNTEDQSENQEIYLQRVCHIHRNLEVIQFI